MRPRIHILIPLLALAATAGWAQGQSGIPATVEGRVTNSITGEGISNAIIRLMPFGGTDATGEKPKQMQTSTQADGSFHMDQITPGNYMIMPLRDGFTLPANSGAKRFLILTDGQFASGLNIQLAPDASLVGKVLDNNSNPVPNARVVALLPSLYGGQNSYEERGSTTCDKNGTFTLTGLPRGRYYLAAAYEIPKPTRSVATDKAQVAAAAVLPRSDEGAFVPTFFPRALSLSEATPVLADPEQGAGNLTIYLQHAFTHVVRGKVADSVPGEGLRVQLTPRDLSVNSALFAPSSDVAADHTFSFANVLPGSYSLRLFNKRSRKLLAREDIDIGAVDVTGLVLNPLPPVVIRGTVAVDSSGTPTSVPSITILARPLDTQAPAAGQTAQSTADGTFTIQRLDPALYSFNVQFHGGNLYVRSIDYNGQDVTNRPVDLSQTGSGQMEVRLASGVGQIDGSVEAASEVNASDRLWILLIPEQIAPDASNVRIAIAKADGTFSLVNVPPGNYQILAADQADSRLWQNPRFLAQIKGQGTSVTLSQAGHEQVQLRKVGFPLLQQTAEQLGFFLP